MTRMRRRTGRLLALLALVVVSGGACTVEASTDEAEEPGLLPPEALDAAGVVVDGPIADAVDLSGVTLWVGQRADDPGDATGALLAELTRQTLGAAGASTPAAGEAASGVLARDALRSGESDVYWEGIGQAWTLLLRQPATGLDGAEIHRQLAARDLTDNGIAWLTAAGFEDGPRFAVGRDVDEADGIATMSDMGARLVADDEAVTCVTPTFTRFPNDGQVAVESALGIDLADSRVREYEPEPIYPDTGEGACLFGLVDATSGRIPEYRLRVLDDDAGAFLPNPPAPAVREDVLVDHPEVATVLDALAVRLDAGAIRGMNRRVVRDGDEVETVVAEWLAAQGLVPTP